MLTTRARPVKRPPHLGCARKSSRRRRAAATAFNDHPVRRPARPNVGHTPSPRVRLTWLLGPAMVVLALRVHRVHGKSGGAAGLRTPGRSRKGPFVAHDGWTLYAATVGASPPAPSGRPRPYSLVCRAGTEALHKAAAGAPAARWTGRWLRMVVHALNSAAHVRRSLRCRCLDAERRCLRCRRSARGTVRPAQASG